MYEYIGYHNTNVNIWSIKKKHRPSISQWLAIGGYRNFNKLSKLVKANIIFKNAANKQIDKSKLTYSGSHHLAWKIVLHHILNGYDKTFY